MIEKQTYICSTTEFTPETDKEDGCKLLAVDEEKHEIANKYVAYHGHWHSLSENGGSGGEKETFLCSTTEFTPQTNKPDGSLLNVIDEENHRISDRCVAYHGYWCSFGWGY